jgi:isoprenylcysteine carboxyl methyltransferase (ICMT) family protein YpbQ
MQMQNINFRLHREIKWIFIEVAQVLTTTILNLCVAIPTNPFMLHGSCLQTTKLMFVFPQDYFMFLFIYILSHHVCSFWKHKLQLSSLFIFSFLKLFTFSSLKNPWSVRPMVCPLWKLIPHKKIMRINHMQLGWVA